MAAIRSEGGLLPADVLARVAALDRDLGGLTVSDFHLAPNERLGEAIARSWARLTAAWDAFSTDRDGLPAGDHAGKLTRERWLLPLFSELGYGRLVQQPGVEIERKTYAVFCEYNHSPIHLVGAGVPLDRRTAGVRGAADQSPHSVVQELLNRSTERLWGIVTNGLSLRLLRDNVTLTRQAYVEFDLEAILATEAYEDFALLWLCAHQSRLEAEAPEDCWLERWTQAAQRDGTRALGELRSGVERAIEALGRGFLAQPANAALHEALRDGSLDGSTYYRELLRLIYRLLFLFVAEDRDALLLPDDGTPERFDARERYDAYYATKRLRRLSVRRRGGRAHDLYEQVKLLSGWLHDGGQPVLALPPLGSALWNPETTVHISDARLGNEALLQAIRELSFVEGGRRPVDFRNLGAEELGSVYESLLELHPEIDREAASFVLTTAAGHERKQTGSYYTPTNLIGSLLETALDPVIEAALAEDDPEQALLDLTVCDPACGSGHFLLAATNRIAKRLAALREGDPEPAPEALRHALRDVVSRCIHGVDVNPMAVELCKVSLWLEALEPGRPLSFLDDRILVGNSLLGTTPSLIESGVPDDAYKPLQGDDKDVVKAWRQHNARERKGQTTLRLAPVDPERDAATLAELAERQRAITDDSPEGVRAREAAYATIMRSEEHERLRFAGDTWIAAFTTPKRAGAARITTGVVRRAEATGRAGLSDEEIEAVAVAATDYSPLHWHTSFPAVFLGGSSATRERSGKAGFDCVLGNPPWEHTELKEKEFFAARVPDIANARTGALRKQMIAALATDDPGLHTDFLNAKRIADGYSHFIRRSGRFPLTARGRTNTYAIFAEAASDLVGSRGRAGVIVPTGIATDDATRLFFGSLVSERRLVSLFDFLNRGFFPDVAAAQGNRFCLLTIGSVGSTSEIRCVFRAEAMADLLDPDRVLFLRDSDFVLFNPNSLTAPVIRTQLDVALMRRVYGTVPVARRIGPPDLNPWGLTFRQGLFNMTSDSGLFLDRQDLMSNGGERRSDGRIARGGDTFLPLYEGKMIHQFHHRFGDYALAELTGREVRQIPEAPVQTLRDPDYLPASRHWVRSADVDASLGDEDGRVEWFLAWRDITAATRETIRTVIAAVIPQVAVGHNLPLIHTERSALDQACLLANLNAFVLDHIARQKLGGTHLTFFVLEQLPILPPEIYAQPCPWQAELLLADWVGSRVLELTYTSHHLRPFARAMGCSELPFIWDPDRRQQLRAELDAAFFVLYGVTDAVEVDRILGEFPTVHRRDVAQFGKPVTRDRILSEFDRLTREAAREWQST